MLGVVRLVGDWEHAEAIRRIVSGALLSRWTAAWMQPLETPDRLYRDLRLEGTVSKAVVNVGRGGEEMDVWTAWQRLSRFVRGEQQEEERGEETFHGRGYGTSGRGLGTLPDDGPRSTGRLSQPRA